jgi:hypothetical protein
VKRINRQMMFSLFLSSVAGVCSAWAEGRSYQHDAVSGSAKAHAVRPRSSPAI